MQSYVVVRLDIDAIPDGLPPMPERSRRVSKSMQELSDKELLELARRRSRSNPPLDLHPVNIAMDEATMRRLQTLPHGSSISALVQYLLSTATNKGNDL